jgi:hypothetical protein
MHTSAFSPSERTEPAHASSLGGSNTASQVRQTEAGVLPQVPSGCAASVARFAQDFRRSL